MELKITVLAENYAMGLPHAEWGFCLHIKHGERTYLLDTGLSGDCAINNAKIKSMDLSQLDGIFISHGHSDHTGGLEKILKLTGPIDLWGHPDIFSKKYSRQNRRDEFIGMPLGLAELKSLGVRVHLERELKEVAPGIHLIGEVEQSNKFEKIAKNLMVEDQDGILITDAIMDDNGLVIESDSGLVVLLGCAHRGVVNICEKVKAHFNRPIHALIGGTHLSHVGQDHFDYVVDYLKREDIQVFGPAHCTGIDRIFELKSIFGKRCLPGFVGQQYRF